MNDVIQFDKEYLITHGAFRYLKFSSHLCKNCILSQKGKCPIYGRTIKHNGKEMNVTATTECPIIEKYVTGLIENTMALSHIRETDLPAVTQLGRLMGFLAIANKFLTEIGAFQVFVEEKRKQIITTVEVQPLLAYVHRYESMVTKLYHELGLTPRSRRMLGLDKKKGPQFSEMIAEVQAEVQDD